MPDSNVPRFQQALQRTFDLKAHAAGLNVIDDVMPVWPITDEDGAEHYYTRGESLFVGYGAANVGAGLYSRIHVRAPPGGIMRIDDIRLLVGTANDVVAFYMVNTAQLANLTGQMVKRDSRWGNPAQGVNLISQDNNAAALAGFTFASLMHRSPSMPATSYVDAGFPQVVLDDNAALAIVQGTVNSALAVFVRGMYRDNYQSGESR